MAASQLLQSSKTTPLKVGDPVAVGGVKKGIVRFVGTTSFAPGSWAGIELDEPIG